MRFAPRSGTSRGVARSRSKSSQPLSRHDAIHAIGWVLAQDLHERMTRTEQDDPAVANARYVAQLERLQAQDWLSQGGDE